MQYFGGKAKIAKPLAAFLNAQLKDGQPFVDLFCGSCNVVSKIDNSRVRMANDLHPELIALWKAVQSGEYKPCTITEEIYKDVKNNRANYPAWLVAFVGFGCSFSGKYFGGFARNSRGTDYSRDCESSIGKKSKLLGNVVFSTGTYTDVVLPSDSLVYCDIPYKGTTGYSTGQFSHDDFYKWAEGASDGGHTVLVSEYKHNLPAEWEIVWGHASSKNIRDEAGKQASTEEILMRPVRK